MPGSEQQWKEAMSKCKLSDEDIRKAKEMGLNPKSLIKNIPSKQQQWKLPVYEWVQLMYEERLEKSRKTQLRKQAALDKQEAQQ
ncbi:MAG: hypothetical protein EOM68_07845 [Spirochaetia bacterium]|nr:hypothetical protein [Spirochaetia bacterium]